MKESHAPAVPQNNSAVVWILVSVAVFGLFGLLLCAGLGAGVYFLAQQARQIQVGHDAEQRALRDFVNRRARGDYDGILVAVDALLAEHPDSADLHNEKAWLLATCPQESIRDGHLAIQHAQRACDLSNWNQGMYLDTLAAAHAEVDDFDEAVRLQEEALEYNTEPGFVSGMRERLNLYRNKQPYRQAR